MANGNLFTAIVPYNSSIMVNHQNTKAWHSRLKKKVVKNQCTSYNTTHVFNHVIIAYVKACLLGSQKACGTMALSRHILWSPTPHLFTHGIVNAVWWVGVGVGGGGGISTDIGVWSWSPCRHGWPQPLFTPIVTPPAMGVGHEYSHGIRHTSSSHVILQWLQSTKAHEGNDTHNIHGHGMACHHHIQHTG